MPGCLLRRASAAAAALGLLAGAAALTEVAAAEDDDLMSMLQKPVLLTPQQRREESAWPIFVPLVRESIPISRGNKVVAHKTSYSGAIKIGQPAEEFRVVFDTGSGHVVLPSASCQSESCKMHKQYNLTASAGAKAVNVDGSIVPEGDLCDQVTIGYGTGEVTGEFARDRVCLGSGREACVDVSIVMAVEMTTQPFRSFKFDGIFGLSLDALAVSPEFSFFNRVASSKLGAALQFGFFLAGADAETVDSEIALGGYNQQRVLTPIHWAPVTNANLGYWQVQIKAVRIGNVTLDICQDGSCRGVVDTGTSHLGVPGKHVADFAGPLSAEAHEGTDCRAAEAPELELVLEGLTLSLSPRNYMRPLPLHKGTALGSGVTNKDSPSPAHSVGGNSDLSCNAKLMPVNLAGSLGQKVFILGEPLLHRYYTVYDWEQKRIGFGLSDIPQNREALASQAHEESAEEPEDVFSFMQVTLTVSVRVRGRAGAGACAGAPAGDVGSILALDGPSLEL